MKIVVDTNVVISGTFFGGAPALEERKVSKGKMQKQRYSMVVFMKKKICFILMLLLLVILTPTDVLAEDTDTNEATSFTVHIVHTNDIHAHVEDSSGSIGVERLKTIIDSYKEDCDLSLVLDSGDLYHGLPIATISNGMAVARLVSALGYDAMTVGNHDWNFGQDRLKELIRASNIKMLTGNVVYEDTGDKFFGNEFDDQFLIKTVEKDGRTLKIGIFGVVDPKIYDMTAPSLMQGIKYTDAISYANEAAAKLREEGCDVVIALTHATLPAEITSELRGVNLCLAGHEHMLMDRSKAMPDGSYSYLYEDDYFLQYIGCYELEIECSDEGVKCSCAATRYDYDSAQTFEKDPDISALLAKIKKEQDHILSKKAGYSPEALDGVWEHLRTGETNLGRAITSAYLDLTGADVAFENAGGIRASINQGDLTYGDIIAVSPYGNYIVTYKMSGKGLRALFEANVELELLNTAADESGEYDAWPTNSGSYLQMGGVLVKYNPTLPTGQRIISVSIGGKPLVEQASYVVAMNNYMAESNLAFSKAEKLNEYTGCAETLINYFSKDANAISKDVDTARWIKTDEKNDPEPQPDDPEPQPDNPKPQPDNPEPQLSKTNVSLKAGKTVMLNVKNGEAKSWKSSHKSIASVSQTGKVTALKKGTATITATLKGGKKLTCKVRVKNSPSLKIEKKKYRKNKTYSVKKGKTLTVKIKGKAPGVKNTYASKDKAVAKVISKRTATTVKIKGVKKGTTTVSVTVNGMKFKIKVKVTR